MSPDPTTERRIADAFRALAETEVPSTAPRPDRAPRPVATGRGSRRRRLQLVGGALLAVAAAVVVALVLGTEVFEARTPPVPPATVRVTTTAPAPTPTTPVSTPTTPATSPSSPPSRPTRQPPSFQQVQQAFAAVAHSDRSEVVTVPGGYEGADLDAGTIRFWRWSGGSWTVVATSTYPPDASAGTGAPTYSATITAAGLLTAMDHATYVVTGQLFTGDGTGSTLAYTDGPAGWGLVKAGSDGALHPSGEGFPALGTTDEANLGLSYGEDLVDGFLRTTDCSPTAPDNAHCGLPGYQVVKYWRWDGSAFVRDH